MSRHFQARGNWSILARLKKSVFSLFHHVPHPKGPSKWTFSESFWQELHNEIYFIAVAIRILFKIPCCNIRDPLSYRRRTHSPIVLFRLLVSSMRGTLISTLFHNCSWWAEREGKPDTSLYTSSFLHLILDVCTMWHDIHRRFSMHNRFNYLIEDRCMFPLYFRVSALFQSSDYAVVSLWVINWALISCFLRDDPSYPIPCIIRSIIWYVLLSYQWCSV